jgi:hypothetical protein
MGGEEASRLAPKNSDCGALQVSARHLRRLDRRKPPPEGACGVQASGEHDGGKPCQPQCFSQLTEGLNVGDSRLPSHSHCFDFSSSLIAWFGSGDRPRAVLSAMRPAMLIAWAN